MAGERFDQSAHEGKNKLRNRIVAGAAILGLGGALAAIDGAYATEKQPPLNGQSTNTEQINNGGLGGSDTDPKIADLRVLEHTNRNGQKVRTPNVSHPSSQNQRATPGIPKIERTVPKPDIGNNQGRNPNGGNSRGRFENRNQGSTTVINQTIIQQPRNEGRGSWSLGEKLSRTANRWWRKTIEPNPHFRFDAHIDYNGVFYTTYPRYDGFYYYNGNKVGTRNVIETSSFDTSTLYDSPDIFTYRLYQELFQFVKGIAIHAESATPSGQTLGFCAAALEIKQSESTPRIKVLQDACREVTKIPDINDRDTLIRKLNRIIILMNKFNFSPLSLGPQDPRNMISLIPEGGTQNVATNPITPDSPSSPSTPQPS